jgi:F420-non-reducing hydrogenase small subunit
MSKLKVAIYWAASCGGCEIAFLEIQARILDLMEVADLVFCPCLVDTKIADVEAMPDGGIDVCLFNGALRTDENVRLARLLRRKSRVLVAFGACATMGGIPGLANTKDRRALLDRAYLQCESLDNPEGRVPHAGALLPCGEAAHLPALLPTVRPLGDAVPVDYGMPGCPPEAERVWEVCEAMVAGALPPLGSIIGAGTETVCEECPLEKHDQRIEALRRPHLAVVDGVTCLLEQGVLCQGIGTRSGCGAKCPTVQMPCRGCYGPSGATVDAGLKLVGALGGLLAPAEEDAIEALVADLADPVGTLYRFGLPSSALGGRRDPVEPPGHSVEGTEDPR